MFSIGMGHGDKYEDDSLDVFLYFNSSCYKGFGDDKEVKYVRRVLLLEPQV